MTPAKKHVKQSKKGITFLMMHQGKSTSPLLRKYVPIVARVRPHRFFAPFAWIKETGFGKMWQGTSNASESLPLTLIEIHFFLLAVS